VTRIFALTATAATVLLALVAGLPGAAGARPSSPTFPPVRPTRVLVLGDSVIKGAEAAVIAGLPGRDVTFDAEVNRSTGTGADIVAQRGADWDVAVVLLGHNDGGSPGVFQPAARSIVDQLRGVPYVSWLTIHEVRPYYPDVNRYIASLEGEYPNLHQGDWNATASAHPEGVSGDGLHLNATGASLMAGLVTEQVEAGEHQFDEALLRFAAAQATTTTTAPPTTTTTAPPTTTSTSASASTSTSTTTTGATTTTTAAEDDPTAIDDPTDSIAPAGFIAIGMAVAVTIGVLVLRWRQRRAERHAADTAG